MTADDPRHGTNAGYNAGCRQPCCRQAHAAYRRRYRGRLYLERTPALTVDGTGTRRRLQALLALGWTTPQIEAHLGRGTHYVHSLLSRDNRISLDTHREIVALYDELSMTLPDVTTPAERAIFTRAKNIAARRGYLPPLAWDDIDNDPTPAATVNPRRQDDIDDVVVQRVLDGQPRPRTLTRAEATEVYRRARARGMSTHEIEARYGLKTERYTGVAS